jgi:hypothetical protein
MPAQSNNNATLANNAYTLVYSDGWKEYLYCSNDSVAVQFAQRTLDIDGLTDLVEVVRHTDGSEVRVWWNK